MREPRTSRSEATAAVAAAVHTTTAESISLVRPLPAPAPAPPPAPSPAPVARAVPTPHAAPQTVAPVKAAPAVRRTKARRAVPSAGAHKSRVAARTKPPKVPLTKRVNTVAAKTPVPRMKPTPSAKTKPGWLRRAWTRLVSVLRSGMKPAFRFTAQRRLQLLEVQQLGDKRFLAVARVGEQTYLIGGGTSSIALLAELDRSVHPLSAPQELDTSRNLAAEAS